MNLDPELIEECEELEDWMFDSINAERDKRKLEDAQIDSDIIPDESGLDGNYFCNLPVFKHPGKRAVAHITL